MTQEGVAMTMLKGSAQAAAKCGGEEAGKQAAKTITEAMIKLTEAGIAQILTAKRAVIISIFNESDLILDKPRWEMKHGHVATEGLPPDEIFNNSTSKDGVVMAFVKPRVSFYGCEGVLLYRYHNTKDATAECYLAIRFKVPTAGQNRCTIAILSQNDLDASNSIHTFDSVTPKLYKYVKKEYFERQNKADNIDQVRSKSSKWMEVIDQKEKVVFGCTMSGEDHAAIKVKISKHE